MVTEILISIAVGVAANLLTPAIRNSFERASVSAVSGLKGSGKKIAQVRLRQLQEERELIEKYASDPITLAIKIADCTVPQALTLWFVVCALIFVSLNGLSLMSEVRMLGGVIFGMLGYATRFPIGMFIYLSDLKKLNNLESFRKSNNEEQEKIQKLIEKEQS